MSDFQTKTHSSDPAWDVLVVEDELMQCEEIADFLSRCGLRVKMAHNAAAALRFASVCQPRVALVDYNLPDENGVQLSEQLRALLPDTAIIVMSGRIDGLSETILENVGISVFINKPLPLGPLRQAVMKLVRSAPCPSEQHHRRGWVGAGVGGTR